MTSTIGQYSLGRTLGSGFSAKVKLATNQEGNQFAIKIFRLDNPEFNARAFQLLRDEVKSVNMLAHKHVLQYFEFNEHAVWNKKNGEQVEVAYIVSELVPGGELFDFVANSGPFGERISRYYAKQLIQAIHYIHTRGFAHRDLKCENVLLDKNYDIKIVDFGFACPVEGRDGSGINRSIVGSLGFMAPEIHARQPYQAQVVDLFALGCILFIMYAGHPPFNMANMEDPHYKLIATNKSSQFWAAHSNRKEENFFNEEFKDLVTAMLSFHPHQRLSIPDIVAHPWIQQGEYATADEVREEFQRRHEQNKKAAQADHERKQATKQHNAANPRRAVIFGNKVYRDARDNAAASEQSENDVYLNLKEYKADVNTTHGFFTTNSPEDIFKQLLESMVEVDSNEQTEPVVSDTHWRLNYSVKKQINVAPEPEEVEDDEDAAASFTPIFEQADIQFEILAVPDTDLLHVQFKRKGGAALLFYERSKFYLDQLHLFNNATLEEGEAQ